MGDDFSNKKYYYNNFRKNKRTASVAESQYKRGFNNSVNITNFNKENAYRYMSVTPSHKHHENKKNKLFSDIASHTTPTKVLNGNLEHPLGHRTFKNQPIEELKDEYNDSKLSFNAKNDSTELREIDVDLEAMILVEDKI